MPIAIFKASPVENSRCFLLLRIKCTKISLSTIFIKVLVSEGCQLRYDTPRVKQRWDFFDIDGRYVPSTCPAPS